MNELAPSGIVSATVSPVKTIIRFTAVVAFVLAALVVLMVCGEGLCESCAHVCLARVDRADRLRRTIARALERMVGVLRLAVAGLIIEPVRQVLVALSPREPLCAPRIPLLI